MHAPQDAMRHGVVYWRAPEGLQTAHEFQVVNVVVHVL
jgi:hypothetical protein